MPAKKTPHRRRLCAAVALALLLCACGDREEPAWRADCLAQVAELEAAAMAADARAREALHGVSPEAMEIIQQAHHRLAAANHRAAEILREACLSGRGQARIPPY
jgi:hypothetical protein